MKHSYGFNGIFYSLRWVFIMKRNVTSNSFSLEYFPHLFEQSGLTFMMKLLSNLIFLCWKYLSNHQRIWLAWWKSIKDEKTQREKQNYIKYDFFYLSCFQVGFLCIIVAPWRGKQFFMARPFDHINMMLVRWLLFRMMFASGVVKLTSQCPTWWGLTAMPTHYVLWPLLWSLKELKWLVVVFYP